MTARPPSIDAFAVLGLAPAFDVDADVLERAFFERSKALHPDRFATAPAAERVVALTKARALNDAYQLLRKPVPRAEYLLAQAGLVIGDNERLDPTQLMPILEAREELQALIQAGKLGEVERQQAAMVATRADELAVVGDHFARITTARASGASVDGELAAIKQILIRLRYVDRYLEACDAALDED